MYEHGREIARAIRDCQTEDNDITGIYNCKIVLLTTQHVLPDV